MKNQIKKLGDLLQDHHAPVRTLLLGHLVFACILGLWQVGALQVLELMIYDQGLRWQKLTPPDNRIVLIGETETDIQRWGYPLPDRVIAETLERLVKAHPRVIGVDKYRDLPVPPGHEQLNQVLSHHSEIIWIMKFGNTSTRTIPINPPKVLVGTDQVGFNDIPIDRDGRVRRGLLFIDDGEHSATAFALMIALRYLQAEQITPQADAEYPDHLQLGATTIPHLLASEGSYIDVDAGGYQYLLDFRGQLSHAQIYTVTDVIEGRIPTEQLAGKIVLIGGMAESLRDDFYIPVYRFISDAPLWWTPAGDTSGRISGVTLHALQINQLLRMALVGDKPIQGLSESVEIVWIWLWCVMGVGLALCRWRFRWLLVLMITALTILTAIWQLAFLQQIWLPWAAPVLGLIGTAALSTVYLSVYERTERRLLMKLFARHVAPEVAEAVWRERRQLLDGGRLLSQRLTATVLFTDIRGFTSISETKEPAQLMDWLNVYMEAMSEVIMVHGGVINKYIGDAIMALFGIPTPRQTEAEIAEDATRAVECGLAMGERLQQLNTEWAQQGLPVIAMRVGIYTGPLVAGSLGSRRRMEYTVLGDTVNIASRLESFDKDAHHHPESVCRVLIGETTFRCLDHRFQTVAVGEVHLKGKEKDIAVYRVDRMVARHPSAPVSG